MLRVRKNDSQTTKVLTFQETQDDYSVRSKWSSSGVSLLDVRWFEVFEFGISYLELYLIPGARV